MLLYSGRSQLFLAVIRYPFNDCIVCLVFHIVRFRNFILIDDYMIHDTYIHDTYIPCTLTCMHM